MKTSFMKYKLVSVVIAAIMILSGLIVINAAPNPQIQMPAGVHYNMSPANSESSNSNVNILTDLGNNNTLLFGNVGINIPKAIDPNYTRSPPVVLSPITVLPDTLAFVGDNLIMSVEASSGLPPYTYSWSFDDGATGAGNAVMHSYSAPGKYLVTATVTDTARNTASSTVVIKVIQKFAISVTPSSVNVLNNQTVWFKYSMTGGMLNYYLTVYFGDGDVKYITATPWNGLKTGYVYHLYKTIGNYTAVFDATDDLENHATAMSYVNVSMANINLGIYAYSPPFYAGTPIWFLFTASGGTWTYNYHIDWGDGSTYTKLSYGSSLWKSYTYANSGSYIVQLNVTDQNGNSAYKTYALTVLPGVLTATLYFNGDPTLTNITETGSQAVVSPITFNCNVTQGFAPYTWYLLNASVVIVAYGVFSSSVINASIYTFTDTRPGTYYYGLLVFDAHGNSVYSNTVTITITQSALGISVVPMLNPIHVFSYDLFYISLYDVQFNGSGYANLSVTVYFGAGTTSQTKNFYLTGTPWAYTNFYNIWTPVYFYMVPGNYTIYGTVNYIGNSTIVSSTPIVLQVLPYKPLVVTWGQAPVTGHAPLTVNFWAKCLVVLLVLIIYIFIQDLQLHISCLMGLGYLIMAIYITQFLRIM